MRNLKLFETVIVLHNCAREVEEEIGTCRVSIEICRAADALHELSLQDNRNSTLAQDIIDEAKK